MSSITGIVVLIIVAAVIAVVVLATIRRRSRPDAAADPRPEPDGARPAPSPPESAPMTGLESALAEATDREGRPIRDRLESEHIDDLRVPDDTGPLLRRALDHIAPDEPADPASTAGTAPVEPHAGSSDDAATPGDAR